jgi:hypothetical protein
MTDGGQNCQRVETGATHKRRNSPDFVIPNEVRDLHFGELQIPHFVRDDNLMKVSLEHCLPDFHDGFLRSKLEFNSAERPSLQGPSSKSLNRRSHFGGDRLRVVQTQPRG